MPTAKSQKIVKLCDSCERRSPGPRPRNPAQPKHTCPYLESTNNDSKTKCNCCNDCKEECQLTFEVGRA